MLCVLATCSRATERLGKQLTRVSKPALSLIARNNLCQYLGVLNEADTLDAGPRVHRHHANPTRSQRYALENQRTAAVDSLTINSGLTLR